MGVSAGSHSLTGETEDAVQWSTSLMIKKLLCERRGKKKEGLMMHLIALCLD